MRDSGLNRCFICGRHYEEQQVRLLTCSDECHEKLLQRLIDEFGEFKKVCSAVTGKCYRVPTRHILEKGLRHDELVQFPEWEEKE
jgi:hypothetical protein